MTCTRILIVSVLALSLGGCAACFPDALKREATAATGASGVITIPGNTTPQPQ
jgi:ABC-type phosphate transport system substrate-binding protein